MFGPQERRPIAVVARQGHLYTAGSPQYDTWTFGKDSDDALSNLKGMIEKKLYNRHGQVVELPEFDVRDNTGEAG